MLLNLNSKTKHFRKACKGVGACQDAVDWMTQIEDDAPLEILIAKYTKDQKITEGWSLWLINFLGTVLDREVRKRFLNAISNPMMAFDTYLKGEHLTEEEDTLLKSKFEGKLPTAEKELKDGKVKRKKKCL